MNNIRIRKIETKLQEINQTIKNFNARIKVLEEQIKTNSDKEKNDRLKRQKIDYPYYTIAQDCFGKILIERKIEMFNKCDDEFFKNNNYFFTQERAQEVVDKMNFLMRLERLHDELCPNYKPNWENKNEAKYSVCYNYEKNAYDLFCTLCQIQGDMVYFPTQEIIQKVINVLNNTEN